MATLRQRDKSPKKNAKDKVSKDSNSPSKNIRTRSTSIKKEPEDDQSYMSLNVLAQVASATLREEPRPKDKGSAVKSKKILSKRSLQTLENLDLEQIQHLSDKSLLSFFSEMTANEITRNFTYTCFLMPKKCQDQFKSFGNETQARIKMRNHLHKHIEQLIDEFNDPDKKEKFVFSAEPIHIRNKRIAEMAGLAKKSKQIRPGSNKKSKFTALKPSKSDNTGNEHEDNVSKNSSENEDMNLSLECDESFNSDEIEGDENDDTPRRRSSARMSQRYSHKQSRLQHNKQSTSSSKQQSRTSPRRKSGGRTNEGENEDNVPDETERRIEENEQFIIDLLNKTQPHHDHCYTTIFGKKRGIDSIDFYQDSGGEEEDNIEVGDDSIYYGREVIRPKKLVEPILCLGNVSVMDELTGTGTDEASKTIIVCAEEIINDLLPKDKDGHDGQRPYPPMPKYAIARRGRIHVPEENEPFSEDEDFQLSSPKKKKRAIAITHAEKEATTEFERKLALKCIRELKVKKKEERFPLHCRICKDKTFTASATLMYHYRSHAGIKPFVCLICNTTFTRQHSLNYHMLIHNNQSRFTCKDCGRKFRHPSHFKEHLRRHTGETPFECTDCPQKFKTRNTYKRHLKTRHGKLLTAAGIRILSVEEFAKIRTKPYRRSAADKLRTRSIVKALENATVKSEPLDDEDLAGITIKEEEIEEEEGDDSQQAADEEEETETDCSDEEKEAQPTQDLYVPMGITVNT